MRAATRPDPPDCGSGLSVRPAHLQLHHDRERDSREEEEEENAGTEEGPARALQPLSVGASSGSGGGGEGSGGPAAAAEVPLASGDGGGHDGPEVAVEGPAAPQGGEELAAEGEGSEEEGEEALVPRAARNPLQPTRAEWEAHQATHLPYRSWCRFCVEGRCDPPPTDAVRLRPSRRPCRRSTWTTALCGGRRRSTSRRF